MTHETRPDLSGYFGIAPRLLPHLAFLLADFDALGSEPELILSWLRERRFETPARILDLGCGKGAVAVALAKGLGARVDGIDLYAPFVAEARARASQAGVAQICTFRVGDIREEVQTPSSYDAVLYVSIGGVLGTPAASMVSLRRCVRPGGVIIIDDAYSVGSGVDFPGYEHVRGREQAVLELTAHGDRIVHEHPVSVDATRAQNRRYMAWIERRARQLREREPALANDIEAFLQKERDENRLLETDVKCVTWMIERAVA